jgi:hypothetical protein
MVNDGGFSRPIYSTMWMTKFSVTLVLRSGFFCNSVCRPDTFLKFRQGRLPPWDLFLIHSHIFWPRSGDYGRSRIRTRDPCVFSLLVSPSGLNHWAALIRQIWYMFLDGFDLSLTGRQNCILSSYNTSSWESTYSSVADPDLFARIRIYSLGIRICNSVALSDEFRLKLKLVIMYIFRYTIYCSAL